MPNVFHIVINPKALEFYADIKKYVMGLKYFQYLHVVEHIGQDTKHYHMLLQLSKSMPKLSVKKLCGAHVQPKKFGSTQDMKDYIDCKDDKHKEEGVTAVLIDEEGEMLRQGGNYTVEYLKNMREEDSGELPAVFYNTYKKIKRDTKLTRARDFRKSVKVYWIQGPSGVGKTNKAIDIATEFEDLHNCGTDFIKFVNGFYLGTTATARIAIYDDFRDSHMKPSEFINLIDYNKHWMNIKGDSILNEYLVIIITSVQRLSKIYRNVDDEPRTQWERRVEIINMFPPERINIGGLPVGYRTDFNQLEEYEVTDDWDSTRVVIH